MKNKTYQRESAAAKLQRDAENYQVHLRQQVQKQASIMTERAKSKFDVEYKEKAQNLQNKFELLTAKYEYLLISLILYSCLLTILQFMGSDRCRSDFADFFVGLWSIIFGFGSLTWRIADVGGVWWILPILIDIATAVCVYLGMRKIIRTYHDYVLMHAETIVGFYTTEERIAAIHEAEIHAAIAAVVPVALLTWLSSYLPKGFNTVILYCIVEIIYIVSAYFKHKEYVYK